MTIIKRLSKLSGIVQIPLLTVLVAVVPLPTFAAEKPAPLLGQDAPMLSGQGMAGRLVSLAQMRREVQFFKDEQGRLIKQADGRYKTQVIDYAVVLNFFATYCIPCVKEIPTFNKIATAYSGKPVRFVYVNVDNEKTPEEVKAFAREKGVAVEMMFPSVSYAVQAYKIETLPRIVVIDRKGKVSAVITGFHEHLSEQLGQIIQPLIASR